MQRLKLIQSSTTRDCWRRTPPTENLGGWETWVFPEAEEDKAAMLEGYQTFQTISCGNTRCWGSTYRSTREMRVSCALAHIDLLELVISINTSQRKEQQIVRN